MVDVRRATAGGYPGRWWYGVAAVVAMATVMVTAVLGYGRATDLIDQVDDFARFDGPGRATVVVPEAGEYSVYHEYKTSLGEGGGDGGFVVSVTGPDGADVPVRPSSVRYGWGHRKAQAIVSFAAPASGSYQIEVDGGSSHLAFGRSIPGDTFRGFGGNLLAAAAILVGCMAGSVVVAKRRRDHEREPVEEATPEGGPRWAIAAVGVVVVLGVGAVFAFMQRDIDDSADDVLSTGAPGVYPQQEEPLPTSTVLECVSDEDFATGLCGTPPEVLREANLSYADRLDFSGDLEAANAIAEQARTALAPLAGILPYPSPDKVKEALAPVSADVTTMDNAVRTSGAAFGIAIEGGCVFGTVYDGEIEVEVGGYVNDGGCLAAYGH